MKRWGALLCLLLLACSEDRKVASTTAPAPDKPAEVAPSPLAAPAPAPFLGPMLIRRKGADVAPSRRGAAGEVVTLEAGELLEATFGCGAGAQVTGPALVAVSARSEQGLLVHHGLVRVELPPGAAKPGPACWLASPALRVELPRAARFALRVHPEGRSQIALVSGRVSYEAGLPDVAAGAESLTLEAGGLLEADLSPRSPARIKAGPSTLEAALAQLAGPENARAKPAAVDLSSRLKPLLTAQLSRAAGEIERAAALDKRHRALVAAHDPAVMDLQRQIAEQAAETFRARRSLEAVLARSEAAHLAEGPSLTAYPLLTQAADLLR